MGTTDRIFRVIIAAFLISLWPDGIITGPWAIVAITFTIVFVITSLVSFCPLYLPFGFSTQQKNTVILSNATRLTQNPWSSS